MFLCEICPKSLLFWARTVVFTSKQFTKTLRDGILLSCVCTHVCVHWSMCALYWHCVHVVLSVCVCVCVHMILCVCAFCHALYEHFS